MRKRIDEDFLNLKSRDICFEDFKNEKKLARTNIGGVKIDDINRICKLIISSNPDVMIEKICYKEAGRVLTFYANKKLDLTCYKEKSKKLVSKSGKNGIKNYLLSVFENCEEIKGFEVSLMDLSALYQEKSQEFSQKMKSIKDTINLMLCIKGKFSFCSFVDFNFNSNVLTLGFDRKAKYRFKINDNKIEALDEDFSYLEDDIWDLYNLYLNYMGFCKMDFRNISSTNTKFFVNFNMLGFSAFLTDSDKRLFSIDFDAFSNLYSYNSKFTSDQFITFVNNNYVDFLNYIYVSVEDLPIWLQKEVLKVKKNDLDSKKNGFLEGARNLLQRIKDMF